MRAMDSSTLTTNVQNTLTLILALSAPALGVAILVGFVIGLFQAVTAIQDQTLPQACKIVAVLATIAMAGRLMSGTLIQHTKHLFDQLPAVGRSVVRSVGP
jgi:type III secretion protein S